MPAPSIRSVGTKASAGTGATTVPLPTDYQVDDILLFFAETLNETLTIDQGFSLEGSAAQASNTKIWLFSKRVQSSGLTAPTAQASTNHFCGAIIAVEGCVDQGGFIDQILFGTDATNTGVATTPTITTAWKDSLVLCGATVGTDTNTPQGASAFADTLTHYDLTDLNYATASGTGGGVAVAKGNRNSTGSTGIHSIYMLTNSTNALVTLSLRGKLAEFSVTRQTTPNWQIFLGDSDDLTPRAEITRECSGKSLQLALNQPGAFNFTIPTTTEWYQYLTPMENCVIVQRDKEVIWSGQIWNLDEDFTGQHIQVGAVGWLENLFGRFHDQADKAYQLVNAGTIVRDIVDFANVQGTTYITNGSNNNSQTRTVTIEQFQNYGEQIKQLTEVENGLDIVLDPETRQLDIHNAADFTITDAVFGFNTGRRNVATFNRTVDASTVRNQYYVRGKFATAEAHDNPSINTYGLRQEVINLTEVTDVSLLGAIANAELALNKDPRTLFNFQPQILNINIGPNFFEHYNVRDQVSVSAERDNLPPILSQATRVFGATITVDDRGNEQVTNLQTTYQSG